MRVTTDERQHVLQLERGVLPAGARRPSPVCGVRAGPQQETFCRMLVAGWLAGWLVPSSAQHPPMTQPPVAPCANVIY